jgi:hypothetical protein
MASALEALEMIRADLARDVQELDGQPFTGRTVCEYLGKLAACVDGIAGIVQAQLRAGRS